MNDFGHSVRAIFLLLCAPLAFSQESDSPKLPDSYAEVVLSVDGMT